MIRTLNMIWPAIYVSSAYWDFWFLIIATIVIELLVVKYFLKFSWVKSLWMTIVGNLISAFIGTYVMMFAMLIWHVAMDNIVPHATFDPINWVATYVLMCFGSVTIELGVVRLIFKEPFRKLFIPMLTGNLLSYIVIAIVMMTQSSKDSNVARTEIVKYLPDQQDFILLDSSKMHLDTCTMELSFDEKDNILNTVYIIEIPFSTSVGDAFNFQFRISGKTYAEGNYPGMKELRFNTRLDTYGVLLEQKNPDRDIGWKNPIITDTLTFRKVK